MRVFKQSLLDIHNTTIFTFPNLNLKYNYKFASIFQKYKNNFSLTECPLQPMNVKFRQAISNVKKQTNIKNVKQADPLSSICAQKLQAIKKSRLIRKNKTNNVLTLDSDDIEEDGDQICEYKQDNLESKKRRKDHWSRFLSKNCDDFGNQEFDVEFGMQKEYLKAQLAPKDQIQTQKRPSQENSRQIFDPSTFNIEQFKQKLGIGVRIQEPIKDQAKNEVPEVVQEPKDNTTTLKFTGRPFEQAPPRPPPKRIFQYPPPCKIAGVYEWPPPKSEYRKWIRQMKETRKLK